MNRTLPYAATLALALVLAACQAVDTRHGMERANDHTIVVAVFNDAGGHPRIEVDVRELMIRGRDHNIFWVIDNGAGQNYTFPENGISFKTQEGRQQFRCRRLNDRKFKCEDPNTVRGRFEYGVTLDGSPRVDLLDPFIINN
jgi:hypothetical protein